MDARTSFFTSPSTFYTPALLLSFLVSDTYGILHGNTWFALLGELSGLRA